MTIAGGLLAALGFFASRFVNELWMLLITFGLISGLGLSLCFNSAIIAVTYYFERRRALATGIAVCGSGIGTFVFAPLIEQMQVSNVSLLLITLLVKLWMARIDSYIIGCIAQSGCLWCFDSRFGMADGYSRI